MMRPYHEHYEILVAQILLWSNRLLDKSITKKFIDEKGNVSMQNYRKKSKYFDEKGVSNFLNSVAREINSSFLLDTLLVGSRKCYKNIAFLLTVGDVYSQELIQNCCEDNDILNEITLSSQMAYNIKAYNVDSIKGIKVSVSKDLILEEVQSLRKKLLKTTLMTNRNFSTFVTVT